MIRTKIIPIAAVQAAAGRLPPLPLDGHTVMAAWSVRKLISAYAGKCLRLRRSTDNVESDFGFVNNELDTAAITTWLNGATGYVVTWYDQSANGNNLSQATKNMQMAYTASGTGGKPQITSSGSPMQMTAADSASLDLTSTFLVNVVCAPASATPSTIQRVISKTDAYAYGYRTTGQPVFTTFGIADYDAMLNWWPAAGLQASIVFDASQDANYYYYGSPVETIAGSAEPSVTSGTFYLGSSTNTTQYFIGGLSEVVILKPAITGTVLEDLTLDTAHYYSLPVAVTPDTTHVTATDLQQLTIPTYDGSGDIIHVGVVDAGAGGLNGYRYWMAMTPWPNANDAYENPSIVASNDKITWVVPDGLTNPVIPVPEGGAYNSDTDLILGQDGKLWMFYREAKAATNDTIYVVSSSDGVTWSAPTLILDVAVNTAACPAVIWDGSQYKMWVIGAGGSGLVYRTCATPDGAWSAPTTCYQFNATIYHMSVVKQAHEYHMFGCNSGVYFGRSLDGKNWYHTATPILAEGYRASGVWNGSGYDLWHTTGGLHSKVKLATVTVPV